jgi:hypothetical protein
MFRIGEFARIARVSSRQLRFYVLAQERAAPARGYCVSAGSFTPASR